MFSRIFRLVCLTSLLPFQVTKSTAEVMDAKALSSTVAKFSAKFCNELDKKQSVVASPLSAEYVLALLALGSTDAVHTELLNSLGIPDDDSIRSSFTEVSNKLKAIKGVTLNVANKVYIMDGPYELNSQLKEDAVKVFDADMEKLDFKEGAHCANLINKWVEGKTNQRIKDLLSKDSLNENTRLVLVNALYFKGTWKEQFEPSHTRDLPFHVTTSKEIKVPMMFMESNFRYGESEELNAQILQLPYIGDEASMVIVLPREIDGLDSVLEKLASGTDLIKEIDNLRRQKVRVTIPKFKIETEIDLKELLPKIGIKSIFDQTNTGLSKILTTGEQLYVSKAVQKAFIEVNEEGAEAAAATAVHVRTRRSLEVHETQVFSADRPALWCLLVDRQPAVISWFLPTGSPRDEL